MRWFDDDSAIVDRVIFGCCAILLVIMTAGVGIGAALGFAELCAYVYKSTL